MIDKEKFLTGLAVLAGAFGREVDGPIQVAYFRVLSPQLSTEEFERAITLTLSSETFWPSPAVILSKVRNDDTSRALAAFEHVNRVTSKHGGFRFLPHEVFQVEFDAPTKAAIAAVGGLHAIANTTDERWAGLQKRFADAYTKAVNGKPASQTLPAGSVDPRVKDMTAGIARKLSLVSGRDRAAGADS